MNFTLHKAAPFFAISLVALLVAGCGTVYGAGKDVTAAGKAISKSAKDNQTF